MIQQRQKYYDLMPSYDKPIKRKIPEVTTQVTEKDNGFSKESLRILSNSPLIFADNRSFKFFIIKTIRNRYKGCIFIKNNRFNLDRNCFIKRQKESLNSFVRNINELQFKYMSWFIFYEESYKMYTLFNYMCMDWKLASYWFIQKVYHC